MPDNSSPVPRASLVPGHVRPEPAAASSAKPAPSRNRAQPRSRSVWVIAFSPAIELLVLVLLAATGATLTWLLIGALAVVGSLGNAMWALADRTALVGAGFEDIPSPLFALLPPAIYLGIRGNRLFRQASVGFRPLWVHLLILLSLPLLVYAADTWGNGLYLASTAV
jgi:hypothetical protein